MAALAFFLTLAAHGAQDAPQCDLVGTWNMISMTAYDASGKPNDLPFGPGASGTLIYTADGHVMTLISHGGRKPLSNGDRITAPEPERAEAFATFFGYSGTYSIKGDTAVHRAEIASVPNWVGTDMVRTINCADDQLELSTPPILANGAARFTVRWKRAR